MLFCPSHHCWPSNFYTYGEFWVFNTCIASILPPMPWSKVILYGGSDAIVTPYIDPRDQSGTKSGLNWSLRIQLPCIRHPGSPQMPAFKAVFLEVLLVLRRLSTSFILSGGGYFFFTMIMFDNQKSKNGQKKNPSYLWTKQGCPRETWFCGLYRCLVNFWSSFWECCSWLETKVSHCCLGDARRASIHFWSCYLHLGVCIELLTSWTFIRTEEDIWLAQVVWLTFLAPLMPSWPPALPMWITRSFPRWLLWQSYFAEK